LFSALLIPLGAALAFALGQWSGLAPTLFLLPAWMWVTLALTVMLSACIVVCGQMSSARGVVGFILPSALVAAAAPALAMLCANAWQPAGFVIGYAFSAMILFFINAFFSFGALSPRSEL
jgi:hypothetical protein